MKLLGAQGTQELNQSLRLLWVEGIIAAALRQAEGTTVEADAG